MNEHMKSINCPWCGSPMFLVCHSGEAYYLCNNDYCNASSPKYYYRNDDSDISIIVNAYHLGTMFCKVGK